MVKCTDCTSRGPRFNSQYSHGHSQPFLTPEVRGVQHLSDLLQFPCTQGQAHTQVHNYTQNEVNKYSSKSEFIMLFKNIIPKIDLNMNKCFYFFSKYIRYLIH